MEAKRPSARSSRPRSTASATAPAPSRSWSGMSFRRMTEMCSRDTPTTLPRKRGKETSCTGGEWVGGSYRQPLAVYIHWPFCRSKCPYCDFNSHVRERIDQARWRQALLAELDHYADLTPGRRGTSLFF